MSLWMVRGGRRGEFEALSLEEGIVGIGWNELPDLSAESNRDSIRELLEQHYPAASKAKISNLTGQLNSFANRIEVGDLVIMPQKAGPYFAIARVIGPYEYTAKYDGVLHVRRVNWLETHVPRTKFDQDLLNSLGSIMTVCKIERNNAEERVKAIVEGRSDSGAQYDSREVVGEDAALDDEELDIERIAKDQIQGHIRRHFKGHELARLVDEILKAKGYVTELSPPGPDGGIDILAASGPLGLEPPRICVQVKSSENPVDVTVLRGLQGSMSTFKADHGLLVSWGGFNGAVQKESRMSFFSVRLWDADDLIDALFDNYQSLSEDIQSELPLKRIWALVPEENE